MEDLVEDEAEAILTKHVWVQMDLTEVEPMGLDEDGEPILIQAGDKEIGVGCFRCNLGLTADNMNTECEGEQDVGSLE